MNWHGLLLTLHLFFDMLWIGSTLALGVLLLLPQADKAAREASGKAALAIYKKVANPSFGAAFTFGFTLLFMNPQFYFVHTKFMHGKLTLALVVIGLTHVLGAKARQLSQDGNTKVDSVKVLLSVLVLSTLIVAYFGVMKPF